MRSTLYGLAAGMVARWSQPPDLNGNRYSSGIISALELASEVADDLIAPWWVTRIRRWGEYWNPTPGDPEIPSLNLLPQPERPWAGTALLDFVSGGCSSLPTQVGEAAIGPTKDGATVERVVVAR
jgi:hypothetical protein